MSRKLIPRLTAAQAGERLDEIEQSLQSGARSLQLVRVEIAGAVPNPTGGEAATREDLHRWRRRVMDALEGVGTGSKVLNDLHAIRLGKAIASEINPSPSDAAHDGTWSFLSLMLFPDVVLARWPADSESGGLSRDRWIGAQLSRDRNYLKLSWRRWQILGTVMESAEVPLGEDEFGALLERTAVARNVRLVRAAAREIVAFRSHGARMMFARELMKEITFLTGPVLLDVLGDHELEEIVKSAAAAAGRRIEPK